MVRLPAGQPLLAVPVDRGRLAARAVGAAHRRDRVAGPPSGGLKRAAWASPLYYRDVEEFSWGRRHQQRRTEYETENPMCALTTLRAQHLAKPSPTDPGDEAATPHSTRCRPGAQGRHDDPSVGGPGPGRDAEPLKVTK